MLALLSITTLRFMPERTMLKGELLLIMRIYSRIHGTWYRFAFNKKRDSIIVESELFSQITQASHQKNAINRLLAFQVVHLFLA